MAEVDGQRATFSSKGRFDAEAFGFRSLEQGKNLSHFKGPCQV